MKKLKKLIKGLIITGVLLFVASLIIYYFNLDMKGAAKISPLLEKYFDSKKKEKHL
ncbi:MAG: hypothetical protein PHQ72_05650 [Hespellia sp.]|nr:hypothetical protein [Hespellia sp.]